MVAAFICTCAKLLGETIKTVIILPRFLFYLANVKKTVMTTKITLRKTISENSVDKLSKIAIVHDNCLWTIVLIIQGI